MPVFDNVFYEVTALLLVAAVVGALALRLRQPLIAAFILIGLIRREDILKWLSLHGGREPD